MIADDLGDGDRMFHGLCRRFDRHVFLLFITEVYRGTMAWREIGRGV